MRNLTFCTPCRHVYKDGPKQCPFCGLPTTPTPVRMLDGQPPSSKLYKVLARGKPPGRHFT